MTKWYDVWVLMVTGGFLSQKLSKNNTPILPFYAFYTVKANLPLAMFAATIHLKLTSMCLFQCVRKHQCGLSTLQNAEKSENCIIILALILV